MVALDIEGLSGLADGDELFSDLRGLDRGHGFGLGAGGDGREIAFEHRHRLGGFDVADDGDDDVRGHVVLLVEVSGLGGRDLADLALPADAGAPVGMRDVGGGEELLDHAADGVGVDAHAPLFLDDVALLVELALDRVADALALKIGPELEAVRRHAPEVLRRVFGGGCVDADCAVLFGDCGELVGDDVLLRLGLRVLEDLQEFRELCGISVRRACGTRRHRPRRRLQPWRGRSFRRGS